MRSLNSEFMKTIRTFTLALAFSTTFLLASCDRSVTLSGPHFTEANYQQISVGMTKAQVEQILGPPTSIETKDVLIYKKTTYRYEDGKKFAMVTFKNDEVDGKETNLNR